MQFFQRKITKSAVSDEEIKQKNRKNSGRNKKKGKKRLEVIHPRKTKTVDDFIKHDDFRKNIMKHNMRKQKLIEKDFQPLCCIV